MKLRHPIAVGALGLAGALTLAAPTSAHVYPSVTEAPAGSYLLFNMVVPHGCEEAATTKIEVSIPEGIYTATAGVVPGWTISKDTEPLPEPVDDGFGGEYTERDTLVTWTGGPLEHDQLVEFPLSVKLPETEGETILFPIIQSCEGGATTEWIQETVEGEEEPEHPAPAITLTAAEGEHGGGGDEETTTTVALDEEAASSDAEDDDSTDPLAIVGLIAGVGGLALGGAAFARTRRAG